MSIFPSFYEFFENIFGIYDDRFSIVFQNFYQYGGYNDMGLLLIGVPLIISGLFYLVWKYPYGTIFHWIIMIVITACIAAGSTYGTTRLALADSLISPDPNIVDFTNLLVLKYTLLNALLSLLVSFLYSLVLKQFSKVQMHLPF